MSDVKRDQYHTRLNETSGLPPFLTIIKLSVIMNLSAKYSYCGMQIPCYVMTVK
jgi:hypothetical protein